MSNKTFFLSSAAGFLAAAAVSFFSSTFLAGSGFFKAD